MNKVIGMVEAKDWMSTDVVCWFCTKQLSPRALFCNHCGAIQPVRGVDHFARLGLERRIDIDQTELERQFAVMQRTLDPDRFAIRSVNERIHAAKQLTSLIEAYEVLRDPVQRGRYWLSLHNKEFEEVQETIPLVQEMRKDFDKANSAPEVDRVAHRATLALEDGIMRLMHSLRNQNWQSANLTLLELDGMEDIIHDARQKRQQFAEKK
ncbi:MAG: Fe-S protein assembly co-chaperone HscB [Alphaproteobacteria bacterium]|nr:Fe-S protein assembly co-chaperone HscB [Alphaproteobacteria bacterium]